MNCNFLSPMKIGEDEQPPINDKGKFGKVLQLKTNFILIPKLTNFLNKHNLFNYGK